MGITRTFRNVTCVDPSIVIVHSGCPMVSFSFLGVPLRSALTGDAQSSFEAVLVAMMGSSGAGERVPGGDGASRSEF